MSSLAPPACAHWGTTAVIEVWDAAYGYWSMVMSIPLARAASTSRRLSTLAPHMSRPITLWWVICTGMPASSPMRIVSRTESSSRSASSRMWEM